MSTSTDPAYNYSAVDLNHNCTKTPFVRCNEVPDQIPLNHCVTVVGNKEEKWARHNFTRLQTTYLITCMECAGNSRQQLLYEAEGLQWDNRAVANVPWGGALLRDMITPPPNDAVEIVFTSLAKGYSRSLPVSVLKERPILVAYFMQHQDIPTIHGGPFRLIVPGWYGMANVKWLDRIYYTNKPHEAEYQTNKYNYYDKDGKKTPVTTMKPKSLITWVVPQNPVMVRGKAWSGHRIERVELCVDGEWMDTDIVHRTGDYGWVMFEKQMTFQKGLHTLASRAYDSTGATQPDENEYNKYGYGNNAVQTITIGV